MRHPITVWFNKGFSHLYHAVDSLRAEDREGEFRILCSDVARAVPIAAICDVFEAEPRGLVESAYIDYCLDIVERHRVKLLIPGKYTRAIVKAAHRFTSAGTKVLAAGDADTLQLLESKADLFRELGPDLVPLPDYQVVTDRATFAAAYARLASQHPRICFKPTVSLFGQGFRIIHPESSPLDRLLRSDNLHIGIGEARACLAERPSFPPLMVMQYLPGPERSVDCLARAGTLLRCVIRKKLDFGQLLEGHPGITDHVSNLTARLRLDGIFNVQFRDCNEVPHLLEINPRMSGGIHYANMSGLAIPYWAVRFALNLANPEDVPVPQIGLRVSQINRAIRLNAE